MAHGMCNVWAGTELRSACPKSSPSQESIPSSSSADRLSWSNAVTVSWNGSSGTCRTSCRMPRGSMVDIVIVIGGGGGQTMVSVPPPQNKNKNVSVVQTTDLAVIGVPAELDDSAVRRVEVVPYGLGPLGGRPGRKHDVRIRGAALAVRTLADVCARKTRRVNRRGVWGLF